LGIGSGPLLVATPTIRRVSKHLKLGLSRSLESSKSICWCELSLLARDSRSRISLPRTSLVEVSDTYVTRWLSSTFLAFLLAKLLQVLDKAWAKQNPNVTRWYETVLSQPIFQAIGRKPIIVEEGLKNVPPKKDDSPKKEAKKEAAPKAPKAPKAAAKPEAQDDEEDEAPAAPKAKHPLEALGKPTLILDDWKRKYSNE